MTPREGDRDSLVLGRYVLLRRLGSGGFGAVWLALDQRLNREVAVKSIPRAPSSRARRRAGDRAQREALAAARLNHPAVVTLYEAGSDADAHYLISELVSGRTLAELIRGGALSDRDVARIGLALAGALAHAHARGVIHRDVKPQNVIVPDVPVEPAGVAKLTDFGVAHLVGDEPLTRTGDVVGTLAYMAPEQAEGRRVGPHADLYALGLVLYEALAGVHPVRGRGPAATARRLGALLPSLGRARRDLPPELVAAIDRAVQPDPGDRGSLTALRAALDDALPSLSDKGGSLARALTPSLPRRCAGRLCAGLAAGGLAAGAASLAAAPASPPAIGLLTAAAVALLPRLAWLAAAAVALGWLAAGPRPAPGAALVVAAILGGPALLLARAGRLWSAPVAAPLLGAATLATLYPVLAAQAATLRRRAALGALGAWWLALAEPLWRLDLYLGTPTAGWPQRGWESSLVSGAQVVAGVAPAGAVLALSWAAAAASLPWLVRGRWLAADLLGAALWTGSVATAGSLALALADAPAARDPRGALAGAIAGALVAVGLRWFAPSASNAAGVPPHGPEPA